MATIPLTGSDRQRLNDVAFGGIYDNEFHTTNDHFRAWLSGTNVLSGGKWLGEVADEAAMIALYTTSPLRCYQNDLCYRLDLEVAFRCINGKGQTADDWHALAVAGSGGSGDAVDITYDNTTSGLTATNVQAALDELAASGGGGGISGTGTDNHLMRWDSTTGAQDSLLVVADSGNTTLAGSVAGAYGFSITNSDTAGGTAFKSTNDNSVNSGFGTYGSAFGTTTFRDAGVFYADRKLVLVSSGAVGTGGTYGINFLTSGYSSSPVMVLDSSGNLILGNSTQAGTGFTLETSAYGFIQLKRSGSANASWGVAGGVNDFITGSAVDDMCYRSDASKSILFSTDNGTSTALKLKTGNTGAVFSAASGTYIAPVTIQANCTNGLTLDLNNTHTGGTKKSQISFLSNSSLTWAFGTDFAETGGDDFWIYQDSASDFRFQIKSDGKLRLKAYGVGTLITDSSGNVTASTTIGTGDFVGPSPATDNAVVRFDGTTGKLGQNSLVTIDDAGFVSIPAIATGSLKAGNLVLDTFNADNESIKFNQIYDGSNTKYIQSSQSGAISFSSGSFYFNTYASGSAGTNITGGKNPLTLFNTGFVGINNQTPSADLTVGNSGNAGTTSLIQSSSYVQLQMMRGTTNKFSLGVASGTGDFFTGTVADDVAFRNEGSKGFLFSTDNGSNVAFSILAANAGVKIQSPLAIADSLVNALLYVKNSYGSSGSGHASVTLDAGQTSATSAFNFAMASTGYWDVGCQGNTNFVIHDYQANRKAFTIFQSGSYAGMTQFLKGGTAITSWDASAVAVFQNNAATSDNANFHIVGGSGTGVSGLWLGNSGNIYGGGLNYINATNQLDFYSNSALALSISSAGAAVFASSVKSGGPVTAKEYTVASLPSASTYAYSFAFVTDAIATAITGLGLAPVGGGSNKVPVYSDGTSWLIL